MDSADEFGPRVGVFDRRSSQLVREVQFPAGAAVRLSARAPCISSVASELHSPIELIDESGSLWLGPGLTIHLVAPGGKHFRGSAAQLVSEGISVPIDLRRTRAKVSGFDELVVFIEGPR